MKEIGRKLLQTIFVIFLASLMLFSLLFFLKGDSSSVVFSEEIEQSVIDKYQEERAMTGGFLSQYIRAMSNFLTLSWGVDITGGEVVALVKRGLGVSFLLSFWAFLFSFPFSLFLSIKACKKEKGLSDCFLSFLSTVLIISPSFLSSIILILFFSFFLKLAPVAGYNPLNMGFVANIRSLFLPSLSLSLVSTAFMLREFKEALTEALSQPYIIYSRAKGMREKDVVLHAALKPSAPVIISSSFSSIISFFTSSTVVENIFALPGLMRVLVDSALKRDYQTSFIIALVVVIIISFLIFLSSLVVDRLDKRRDRE